MAIENKDLPSGTKLVAKYKGQQYVCLVKAADSGDGVVFALQGGKTHKSPSSAGMEVMGGKAVNGWRFWTAEGEVPTTSEVLEPQANRKRGVKAKTFKLFKRLPSIGLEEGQHRIWCQACQKSFVTSETDPEVCPEGHRADDPELTGVPSSEAVAADKADVEA